MIDERRIIKALGLTAELQGVRSHGYPLRIGDKSFPGAPTSHISATSFSPDSIYTKLPPPCVPVQIRSSLNLSSVQS
jgi:hypothetical protein